MSEIPQIKVAEPEPSDENPWLDDKLGRKDCAGNLTTLINGQVTPMTISVNGEWGSGKTFMLKRWQKQLEKDGCTAIYFNAWEDDFLADPLVGILGQLQSALISKLGAKVKKEISVAYKVIRNSALRFATAGCADPDDLTPDKTLLDAYAEHLASRSELKVALERLIAKLPQDKLPLVFIIDELDRCRPTFAIEVLERIKHLFNIDHIIFVLGIDRKNLGKSIQSVYGEVDVENYLHRFFDFDFRLPDAEPKKFIVALWSRYNIGEYLSYLANADRPGRHEETGSVFLQQIIVLLIIHRFTLREIEQCIKLYALTLKVPSPDFRTYPELAPILIVLKLRNLELYRKYINYECPPNEVIDFLIPSTNDENSASTISVVAVVYATYLDDRKQRENVNAIQRAGNKASPLPTDSFVAKSVKTYSQSELGHLAQEIGRLERGHDRDSLHGINEILNLFSFIQER